jgi:lipopolysaccharide/colanic/teichoic acid biosynthesis glycosyltransferase
MQSVSLTIEEATHPKRTTEVGRAWPATPPAVRVLKRCVDIVAAILGLVLTAGLAALLMLAIYIDSPGPVFYCQKRASGVRARRSHGRFELVCFKMWKLRTMRVGAEAETGATLARENDPRVTRVGWFLRKTRLDELPQLWNVLVGDMSLVGPRPERPELFENLVLAIPFFEERMRDCKPGLTGLAQVSLGYTGRAARGTAVAEMGDCLVNPFKLPLADGAEADDMRTKLLFDLAYVASLEHVRTFVAMDLLIILKTPWVMLRGLGR